MASISSSMSCAGGSPLLPTVVGITGRLRTLKASARLAIPAGDPNDMGLPEYELHFDLLGPWSSPGGAVRVIGDPGNKFRNLFSQSVTGDILGRMPTLAKSKHGITVGTSL